MNFKYFEYHDMSLWVFKIPVGNTDAFVLKDSQSGEATCSNQPSMEHRLFNIGSIFKTFAMLFMSDPGEHHSVVSLALGE
jgi:hypothetical protein